MFKRTKQTVEFLKSTVFFFFFWGGGGGGGAWVVLSCLSLQWPKNNSAKDVEIGFERSPTLWGDEK